MILQTPLYLVLSQKHDSAIQFVLQGRSAPDKKE